MSYRNEKFLWTKLLFRVMTIPFLILLILMIASQTMRIRESLLPEAPTNLPSSGNWLKEVPLYP